MNLIVKLLVTGGVMGLLDFIWLGIVAKKLYRNEIGQIMLGKPNMVVALLFYLIYVVGVVIFVVNPALHKGSFIHALGYGALFGLVAYATFDLTSLAALKGFTVKIVAIDIIWGVILTSIMSSVAFLAVHTWMS